jgi:methionyl-tRNA synthetase
VTAAPPTPNGSLHLGHLSGPYMAADMLVRSAESTGTTARWIVGTDDHQTYVPIVAAREATEPAVVADRYGREIRGLFEQAGFANAVFMRSARSPGHVEAVQDFFRQLWDRGHLRAVREPAPWCPKCDHHLLQGYLAGACPGCDEDTDGYVCEACAAPNNGLDVGRPRCNICGTSAVTRHVDRLVFPLRPWVDAIRRHLAAVSAGLRLRSVAAAVLAGPLPDAPVTHPGAWGVPSGLPGFEADRVDPWAEMLPGYLAATAELMRADPDGVRWDTAWRDPGFDIVQCFGIDNGWFHTVLHPALLLAWDSAANLPRSYVTNEFYQLCGQKFSTSRRHAVWAADLLRVVPADTVRMVLASDRPEHRRTDFDLSRLAAVTRDLSGRWDGWIRGALARADAASELGPALASLTADQAALLRRVESVSSAALDAYRPEAFSPCHATRALADLVRIGEDLSAALGTREEVGIENVPDDAVSGRRGAAAVERVLLGRLAVLSAPVMPQFAARLWSALGHDGEPRWLDVAGLVGRAKGEPGQARCSADRLGTAISWFESWSEGAVGGLVELSGTE